MERLRRLPQGARWVLPAGVALAGLLVTFLAEGLLADNALAYSSDARSGFLLIGGIVSVVLGVLVLGVMAGVPRLVGQRVDAHGWRFGSLFWRLAISYFLVSFTLSLTAVYASRFDGPFGFLRDSPLVDLFKRLFDNSTNGELVLVLVICLIGVLTGALISRNLRRRLRSIAQAAEAWSRGDFAVAARDPSGDELGQLARDLNRMAEQLQTLLATQQELAVVEERNRLARELHDTVKQHVFANALLVRAARKQMERHPDVAKRHLQDAEELAGQTQQELVDLIHALRPAAVADKGLVAVLREQVDAWSRRTGIATDLRVQGERSTLLEVEDALLRVAQEALTNVARHSGAQDVDVRLAWEGDRVWLAIRDYGMGFDLSQGEGKGLGLTSMRERVEALGGMLALSSSPNGTTVEASVPLAAASPQRAAEVVYE